MIPHRTMTGFAATVFLTTAFVALAAAAVGCGGGSSTTTTSSGPVAVFTPDTAVPPPGTIALLSGSTSGASVNVRVAVTGVSSFFGTAFRIKYDTTALLFNGMTDSGSFLRVGVTDPNELVFLANSTSQPGQIVITATRVYPAVPVPTIVVISPVAAVTLRMRWLARSAM